MQPELSPPIQPGGLAKFPKEQLGVRGLQELLEQGCSLSTGRCFRLLPSFMPVGSIGLGQGGVGSEKQEDHALTPQVTQCPYLSG